MSNDNTTATATVRTYTNAIALKYGCNPHQSPSSICTLNEKPLPFRVLNGKPGYINFCDALNAFQLVKECKRALNLPAAASFKHVSPAGAAVAVELTEEEKEAYEVVGKTLTPTALAYLRARQADPMCSYGDFSAVSEIVDEATANILKVEVSDGIIAPGYSPAAFEILKAKKNGGYIIIEMDLDYNPPEVEYREIYGVGFMQKRNDAVINEDVIKRKIVTENKDIPEAAVRDLILASICIKYTQSNSVGYARNGMMVGVGAGQQSRVDCAKLAGRKVETWWCRQHPKVRTLKFKEGVKRQDKINARVAYIEDDFTPLERVAWEANFDVIPPPFTAEEKKEWVSKLSGTSCSSDAFFPFRDSIDQIARRGVKYVAQPGGSVADDQVIKACNEYGMTCSFTDIRLFHH